MYQLLARGQHPCHVKGEPAESFIERLQNIETQPIQFEYPPNFSSLAIDFFEKLCSYPQIKRYNAVTALEHPWITRSQADSIPPTINQNCAIFDQERELRKVMRSILFAGIAARVSNEGIQEYKEFILKLSGESFESTSADSKPDQELLLESSDYRQSQLAENRHTIGMHTPIKG